LPINKERIQVKNEVLMVAISSFTAPHLRTKRSHQEKTNVLMWEQKGYGYR